ncbi:PEF-CTERM sorting domain-containing protein [Methanolobus sp.]|uniref:PEF-CTERM sorting domain-containing protein n=1 Tax=Methanolobus sp. TaxID=1874737 RepID=UPI0025D6F42C|nr:PEF-CTERM sorting domain-containing protein [Methanolobus sp.]
MKYVYLKQIFLVLLATLMVIGTASAVTAPYANVELIEDVECSLDIWRYGNDNVIGQYDSYFSSLVSGSTWTDVDGRLAVLDEDGYMQITTQNPTECFCIVFASDSNDGWAKVYVDGNEVWSGDTWADVGLTQDINAQKIRSLKITDLENTVHTIKIKNINVANCHNGHVTIYKYGYNCPETTEIPEFPTIALPVAAILGLAFIFQRKQE